MFDAMKTRATVFLLVSTGLFSWAGELPKGDTQLTQKDRSVYEDFKNRLEAAVAGRELASIAALYQTNDVSAIELKSELARWQRVVAEGARPMAPYLKTLSELPPESHDFWEAGALRRTRHQVTHFSIQKFITKTTTDELILPLVLVGDKLMIVPSEKISTKGIEPDGGVSRSQQFRPGTNRAPPAAGPGR